MKDTRFRAIFNGLSAIAAKIYEAVPISESWTANQIAQELFRRKSTVRDISIIRYNLSAMVASGIVNEAKVGWFRRTEVKPPEEKKEVPKVQKKDQPPMPVTTSATPAVAKKTSAIDALLNLSAKAREIAKHQTELAEAIDEAALEITEAMQGNEEAANRLKQLQVILHGV
jgi:hypothetical protein